QHFGTGTGSLQVAFTALPAGNVTTTTRRIFINKPNIYCGQTTTFHVYLPAGSDGLTYQVYAHYNNYGAFTGTGPPTVTRDALNTATYMIPNTVGPGGLQRVGIEFMYSGAAPYTGNVYIDQITW